MSRETANLLRLISITAVLIIHLTSPWELAFLKDHNYFSEDFLASLMNQWARFAVPVFVIISGYGLSKRYAKDGSFELGSFFKRRFVKIGLPFVVITIIILLLNKKLTYNGESDFGSNLVNIGNTLFTYFFKRGADYHFYFFTIILECYLFFPLLRRVNSGWFLLVLLLNQLYFTSPSHLFIRDWGLYRPSFPSSFIAYWVFYFYLGIFWAKHEKKIKEKLARIPQTITWLLLLATIALVMSEYVWWSYRLSGNANAKPDWYNHFHRWVVIVYAIVVVGFYIRFDKYIQGLLKDKYTGQVVAVATGLSFTVYIFHTWVLRGLRHTFFSYEVIILTVALVSASFFMAHLLNLAVPFGWLRILLGLPEQKLSSKKP